MPLTTRPQNYNVRATIFVVLFGAFLGAFLGKGLIDSMEGYQPRPEIRDPVAMRRPLLFRHDMYALTGRDPDLAEKQRNAYISSERFRLWRDLSEAKSQRATYTAGTVAWFQSASPAEHNHHFSQVCTEKYGLLPEDESNLFQQCIQQEIQILDLRSRLEPPTR